MPDLTIADVDVDYAGPAERPLFQRGTEETIALLLEDRDEYDGLREYLDIDPENAVRRGTTDRGRPWFRERVTSDAAVSTFLVDIETSAGLDWPDVWALIVGGEDETTLPADDSMYRLDLTLFVLAPLDEHGSPESVRTAYGDDI